MRRRPLVSRARLIPFAAIAVLFSVAASADPVCAHTPKAHACRLDDGTVVVKVGHGPWIAYPVLPALDEAAPLTTAPILETAPLAADTATTIDLAVVGTPASVSRQGGPDAFAAFAALIANITSDVYARSLVPQVQVRLVGSRTWAYTETGSLAHALSTLASDPTIAAYRNSVGADVVQGITEDTDAAGIGYLGGGPSQAFSAVSRGYAVANLSSSHEIGHNEGMGHDPGSGCTTTPACGYINPSCAFRTVMAYGGCPRVRQLSSPVVFYNGLVTGTTSQDNRARLLQTAATVAAYRAPVAPPVAPSSPSLGRVM